MIPPPMTPEQDAVGQFLRANEHRLLRPGMTTAFVVSLIALYDWNAEKFGNRSVLKTLFSHSSLKSFFEKRVQLNEDIAFQELMLDHAISNLGLTSDQFELKYDTRHPFGFLTPVEKLPLGAINLRLSAEVAVMKASALAPVVAAKQDDDRSVSHMNWARTVFPEISLISSPSNASKTVVSGLYNSPDSAAFNEVLGRYNATVSGLPCDALVSKKSENAERYPFIFAGLAALVPLGLRSAKVFPFWSNLVTFPFVIAAGMSGHSIGSGYFRANEYEPAAVGYLLRENTPLAAGYRLWVLGRPDVILQDDLAAFLATKKENDRKIVGNAGFKDISGAVNKEVVNALKELKFDFAAQGKSCVLISRADLVSKIIAKN